MITTTTRPFTDNEKKQQVKSLLSFYHRFEEFAMASVIIGLILCIPLLAYDHFFPVASNIQAVYVIVVAIIALVAPFWIARKNNSSFSNGK